MAPAGTVAFLAQPTNGRGDAGAVAVLALDHHHTRNTGVQPQPRQRCRIIATAPSSTQQGET
jgi:hypothetical protein